MPYENEYSCRLKDPGLFKDPWVRVKRKSKSMGKVYSVIRGTLKTTGKFEDQAFRYPKTTWTASQARSHCKSHSGSWEAAASVQRIDALVAASLKTGFDAAHRHNSEVADGEPAWSSVDKTALPRSAFADPGDPDKKSTWGYPHHWIKGGTRKNENGIWIDGTMYLHRGGLNAAWAMSKGARSGKKASSDVVRHLARHRKALGLEEVAEDVPYEAAQGKYNCECIKCGYKLKSDKHCDTLKCPKCGGAMRRQERPGPGKERGTAETKTRISYLADRIVNTPLMITTGKLHAILSAVGDRIGLQVEPSDDVVEIKERDEQDAGKRVAVIPIHDTLVHRMRGLNAVSGLSSYEEIGKKFRAALKNDSIDVILLDVDSPGGEVSGVFDLTDEIYEARGKKPIIAVANEVAFSAAYALASAADSLYLSRTGGVGSIGVIAVHTDWSKYDEKLGVKYTPIFAGSKKDNFSTHKPLSQEAVKDIQTQVDEVYELFVNTVARNRGMSPEEVRKTEAATYLGIEGVKAGLADDVLSWDQVLETLSHKTIGGINMSDKAQSLRENLDALLAELPPEEVDAAFSQVGYVRQGDGDIEALQAEITELREELAALKADDDEYRASVRAEITKELSEKGADQALQARVAELEKEAAKTKADLEKARDNARLMEIENEIRAMEIPGDIKKKAKIALSLEKIDLDLAKEHMSELRKEADMLHASGVFMDLGSVGDGKATSAYERLLEKKNEIKKADSALSDAEAYRQAVKQNPDLYKEYLEAQGGGEE